MTKNFHNGTNIIAKHTPLSWEKKSFMTPSVKHTLVSWHRIFQPLNLERKLCVIEKFWKYI
jgi:hypothetical protein